MVPEAGVHRIDSPDGWWTMVLGSGYRGTIEQLDAADREHVRLANLDFIRRNNLKTVQANVVYAIASKALSREPATGP